MMERGQAHFSGSAETDRSVETTANGVLIILSNKTRGHARAAHAGMETTRPAPCVARGDARTVYARTRELPPRLCGETESERPSHATEPSDDTVQRRHAET